MRRRRVAPPNGLRRSEVLALRWSDVDTVKGTLRIDEGLVAVNRGVVWSEAKNARSRRVIPLDSETLRDLARRRKDQAQDRLLVDLRRDRLRRLDHPLHPMPGTPLDLVLARVLEAERLQARVERALHPVTSKLTPAEQRRLQALLERMLT